MAAQEQQLQDCRQTTDVVNFTYFTSTTTTIIEYDWPKTSS